jgi:transposase-like protein
MGKRGHSGEEILRVLREAESGDTVVELSRKHWISQQTFYLWKKLNRKNSLFVGNARGGRTAAILANITSTSAASTSTRSSISRSC